MPRRRSSTTKMGASIPTNGPPSLPTNHTRVNGSIDILLRVHAGESHGTTPLGWEFQVCRLPSQHTVGIGVGPVVGSLLGVPSPRYPYLLVRRPAWLFSPGEGRLSVIRLGGYLHRNRPVLVV